MDREGTLDRVLGAGWSIEPAAAAGFAPVVRLAPGGTAWLSPPAGMRSARLGFARADLASPVAIEVSGQGGARMDEGALDPSSGRVDFYVDLPSGEAVSVRSPAAVRLETLVFYDRPLAVRVDLADPASFAGEGRFLNIRMDLNNWCNLRCRMCYVRAERPRPAPFPLSAFREMARSVFPRTRMLFLSCGFEPLANPDFAEALDIVGGCEIPRTGFATNGLLFDEKIARRVIENRISCVLFSLDGARRSTYDSIRQGSSFRKVVANIRRLNDLKSRAGLVRPRVYLNFVLMMRNLRELPAMVPLAASLEASYLSVSPLEVYEGLGMEDQRVDLEDERTRTIFERTKQAAGRFGVNLFLPAHRPLDGVPGEKAPLRERLALARVRLERSRRARSAARAGTPAGPPEGSDIEDCPVGAYTVPIPDGDGGSVETPCVYPWFLAVVHSTGNVVPCCFWHDPVPLGNLLEGPIERVFDSPAYRRLRAELRTGELRETCRHCSGKTHASLLGRPQVQALSLLG